MRWNNPSRWNGTLAAAQGLRELPNEDSHLNGGPAQPNPKAENTLRLSKPPGEANTDDTGPGQAAAKKTSSGNQTATVPNDENRRSSTLAAIGTTIDDRYELKALIGRGGMSAVYAARDIRLRKTVAVKMLLPHLVENPQNLQRFHQEAAAASNLSHPNIVSIHNYGETIDGNPYLVMDYLEGETLSQLITQHGSLSVDRAVPIFLQICAALSHAHENGVVHRDLKPSNVTLVTIEGKADIIKILDFGIAKILPTEGRDAVKLTQTGEIFGSPLYMSPEQCRGERLDTRADIYSMGCLMYEALTGSPPFSGENSLEVMYKHISETPPSFAAMNAGVSLPDRLEAIVFKSLAKDVNARYQTMKELKADLEKFQTGSSGPFAKIMARFQIARTQRKPFSKREKIAVVAASTGVVLAAAFIFTAARIYQAAFESPLSRTPLELVEAPEAPAKDNIGVKGRYIAMQWLDYAPDLVERGDPPQKVMHNLRKAAQTLYRNGYKADAIKAYSVLLNFIQKYVGEWTYGALETHIAIGNTLFEIGEFSQAQREFEDIVPAGRQEGTYIPKGFPLEEAVFKDPAFKESIEKEHEHLRTFGQGAAFEQSRCDYRLAIIYHQRGDMARAAHRNFSAIALWKKMHSVDSRDYAAALSRLAQELHALGDTDRSLATYSRAIEAWQEQGPRSGEGASTQEARVNEAVCHARVAQIMLEKGNLNDATESIRRSYKLMSETKGTGDVYTGLVMLQYAVILDKTNDPLQAFQMRFRAGQIFTKSS